MEDQKKDNTQYWFWKFLQLLRCRLEILESTHSRCMRVDNGKIKPTVNVKLLQLSFLLFCLKIRIRLFCHSVSLNGSMVGGCMILDFSILYFWDYCTLVIFHSLRNKKRLTKYVLLHAHILVEYSGVCFVSNLFSSKGAKNHNR